MMHTIRLLQVAEEIIRDGQLNVKRNNRDELLSIKNGEWEYEALLKKADDLIQNINTHFASSPLQEKPNAEKAIEILVEMRTELYK